MLSLGQPAVKEMITEALYPRATATHEGASSGSTRNLELNNVAKQTCDTDAPQLSSVLVPQSVSVYLGKAQGEGPRENDFKCYRSISLR